MAEIWKHVFFLKGEIKFYLKFTCDGVNGIEYNAGIKNKTDNEIAYANVNLAVGENAVSIIDDNFDDPVKLVLLNAEHDPIAQFDMNGQHIEIDEETQEEYSELPFVFPHVQKFGDCNGDGEVNRADRIYLARAIADWDGYELPPVSVADFNGDGEVNRADRIYLARWDGYVLNN